MQNFNFIELMLGSYEEEDHDIISSHLIDPPTCQKKPEQGSVKDFVIYFSDTIFVI